jgi:hypothetical protein
VTLCEICQRRTIVFQVIVRKLLKTVAGTQSKHVPWGREFMIGVCEECLPFEKAKFESFEVKRQGWRKVIDR